MELEQQNCIHFWAFSTQITANLAPKLQFALMPNGCRRTGGIGICGVNWDIGLEMSLCLSQLEPDVQIHPVQWYQEFWLVNLLVT